MNNGTTLYGITNQGTSWCLHYHISNSPWSVMLIVTDKIGSFECKVALLVVEHRIVVRAWLKVALFGAFLMTLWHSPVVDRVGNWRWRFARNPFSQTNTKNRCCLTVCMGLCCLGENWWLYRANLLNAHSIQFAGRDAEAKDVGKESNSIRDVKG